MDAQENPDKAPVTRNDLVDFRTSLLASIQEQFAAADRRNQEQSAALELRMLERMEAVETRLLTAFQQWAVPINARLRKLEAGDGVLDERLAMIEERIMTIERRLGAPSQRM